MPKTKHRTKVSFLDGREPIILIGWLNAERLLKRHGEAAIVEYGQEYKAVGDDETKYHNIGRR